MSLYIPAVLYNLKLVQLSKTPTKISDVIDDVTRRLYGELPTVLTTDIKGILGQNLKATFAKIRRECCRNK